MAAPQLLARIVGAVLKETVMLAFIHAAKVHDSNADYRTLQIMVAGKWQSFKVSFYVK